MRNLKLLFEKMYSFLGRIKNIVFYGAYSKPYYLIFEKQKLIYIPIPKCWSTSILLSLSKLLQQKKEIKPNYLVHELKLKKISKISKKYLDGSYTIFTVVRDPFERLISCYENQVKPRLKNPDKKIIDWGKHNILNYLFGYLQTETESFEKFLRKIVKIPVFLMDPHFYPMHKHIWVKDASKIIFLDLENLDSQFEPIRKRFDLPKLKRANSSWKNNEYKININELPPLLLKKIINIYRKDFEMYEKVKKPSRRFFY